MASAQLTKALQALTQHIQSLTDHQGPAIKFTHKFTGDHAETLNWCHAVDMYKTVNVIEEKNEDTGPFKQIFSSLPEVAKTLYMMKMDAIHAATPKAVLKRKLEMMKIAELKQWVVQQYPPVQSRVDFIKRLKRVRMRRNEDPVIVYNKLLAMISKVGAAIKTINAGRPMTHHMAALSANDLFDICCSVFIINNNKHDRQNDGQINAATVAYIVKSDPQKFEDFTNILTGIHTKITPKCTAGIRKFQAYPNTPDDFNPYSKSKQSKPPTKGSHGKPQKPPTKPYNDRKRGRSPPHYNRRGRGPKRQKYGDNNDRHCTRCFKKGHITKRCMSYYSADGTFIGTNTALAHCSLCGRHSHMHHDCYAPDHIDGTKLNNPNARDFKQPRRGGFQQYDKLNKKGKGGKDHHSQSHKQSLQYKDMQRSVMLLGQAISGDTHVNPAIKSQFATLADLFKSKSDPRKS